MKFKMRIIEKLRIVDDLTVGEMAKKLGISRQTYYVYLSGYGNPTLPTIEKIAKRSRMPEEDLIEFSKV
jgi:DNA-binding XRE family transcriptional regulator